MFYPGSKISTNWPLHGRSGYQPGPVLDYTWETQFVSVRVDVHTEVDADEELVDFTVRVRNITVFDIDGNTVRDGLEGRSAWEIRQWADTVYAHLCEEPQHWRLVERVAGL